MYNCVHTLINALPPAPRRLIINSINEEQTISSFVYDAYLHDGIFSYDRKFIGILILCALLVAMNILFM